MGVEKLTFLEEGEFTQRDDHVVAVANQLKDAGDSPWGMISRIVGGLKRDESRKDVEYRNRGGSDILKSGYVTGCTDSALAFIVLARELGLPTAFVETYKQDWLQNITGHIKGHIYTDLQMDGKWRAYDPIRGFVEENSGIRMTKRGAYVEVARGVDPGELYPSGKDSPISLLTFDSMIEFAKGLEL